MRQAGSSDLLRGCFLLSASSSISVVTDLLQVPGAYWGSLSFGCHPDCGICIGFMVSKKTKQWAPLSSFIDVERMLKDAQAITDARRGRLRTIAQSAVILLRNHSPSQAPSGPHPLAPY